MRGHWGLLGDVRAIRGCIGATGSVVLRGQKGSRCHLGSPRGVGAVRGCRDVLGVASGLGAQPNWAPVQGPSTPTGSHWGVTYLTKARQGPLLRVPSLPLVSLGE